MNLFPDWPSLASSGYLFRIVDTRDTYTPILVMFSDGNAIDVSQHGDSGCWIEGIDPATLTAWCEPEESSPPDLRRTIGEDLTSADLSEDEKAHILRRVNEAWRDCLESVAARHPSVVSPDRYGARVNQCLAEDAGDGLYTGPDGALWVRLDCPEDDRGPYTDPAEALRATLPDKWGLAGPEYHSPAFPEIVR